MREIAPITVRAVTFTVTQATDGRFQLAAHDALAELAEKVREEDAHFHADLRQTPEDDAAHRFSQQSGRFVASNGCVINWDANRANIDDVRWSTT